MERITISTSRLLATSSFLLASLSFSACGIVTRGMTGQQTTRPSDDLVERSIVAEAQALLSIVRIGAEVYYFDHGDYPDDPLRLFDPINNPCLACGEPGRAYVDGDPQELAPSFVLSGSPTGAVATGIGGRLSAGRQCSVTYGVSDINCN